MLHVTPFVTVPFKTSLWAERPREPATRPVPGGPGNVVERAPPRRFRAETPGPTDANFPFPFRKRFFIGPKSRGMSAESTEDRILSVLEEDAQASYAEIADRAGVSKPTVRKYIDRLEQEGVIVGYSADVDPKKLSGQSIAMVGIEVASESYVEATRELKALDAVEALYASSGDHTLMAEVRAADGDGLGEIIADELHGIEGVEEAHPSFLQERLK